MDPSSGPKQQQFFLTTADGSGAGKVILASPDTNHTKQLIFTAGDSLMPAGRIQVHLVQSIQVYFCHVVLRLPYSCSYALNVHLGHFYPTNIIIHSFAY